MVTSNRTSCEITDLGGEDWRQAETPGTHQSFFPCNQDLWQQRPVCLPDELKLEPSGFSRMIQPDSMEKAFLTLMHEVRELLISLVDKLSCEGQSL